MLIVALNVRKVQSMGKKKAIKPLIHVTVSLGLFYVVVEAEGLENEIIGPFKSLDDAEIEKINQRKLRKNKWQNVEP
ncbi:hypothetical protein C5750_24415 [Phyllobacterium myrsinacearum]|uniref:Uncharacterized protein n=2 Tax=Phyllobacterium myrsinacearum TaxID=28101 RepID=A0A2S9JAZ9_9HYPH|nr:hypothetical protein C5750_24415 [Phyllobacterium myrsinacearum]